MITNTTDNPRKITWVKGGLSLPAGEGKVVDGFYPTACHNAQSLKTLMSDVKEGRVRLTIVTNLEISRTSGKAQGLETAGADGIQEGLAEGDVEVKRKRRSKAQKAQDDADAAEAKKAAEEKEDAPKEEDNLDEIIARGNVPDTNPASTKGNVHEVFNATQDDIKSDTRKAYEKKDKMTPGGTIEDHLPKAVSLDGSHKEARGPQSTVDVFASGHPEEGRDNNPHTEDEPNLDAVQISESAARVIADKGGLTDEQTQELMSRATGENGTIVTRRDVLRYFESIEAGATEVKTDAGTVEESAESKTAPSNT